MDQLIIWCIIFIAALAVLIKASDYFTEGAEKLGLHFGIPAFIVGVTIVAFGTSLPELVSSLLAVFAGSSDIVAGNVIGSNIANILLVLAIAAIIGKKFFITHEIEAVDLPLLVGSAFLLFLTCIDGFFSFGEGVIMLLGIIVYIFYAISNSKSQKSTNQLNTQIKNGEKESLGFKVWTMLLGGAFFVFIGAKYTIDSVIEISAILDIGTDVIAIIAVALGTSLPELMVTISAAKKGNAELAIGNVLGSNIFNSFMVMGIPALFAPWFTEIGSLIISPSILNLGLPVMLFSTILFMIIARDKQINQWEGWLLLLCYIFFVGSTFNLL